jgi:SAM-dependent methyltransferase
VTLSEGERQTAGWYDTEGERWSAGREDPFWDVELGKFLARLTPGTEILEVGSGFGRDAAIVMKAGFGYLGTDVSPGMLKLARERVPRGRFVIASPYAYGLGRTFRAWMALASLGVHVPPRRMGEALGALRRVLEPGAFGVISAKPKPDGTVYGPDSEGRMRTLWRPSELREILAVQGFTVVDVLFMAPDSGPRAGDRGWVSFITETQARRPPWQRDISDY